MNDKDPISFVPAAESRLGGGDFVISLTPEQKKALGVDARDLVDWLHTALSAMALLRTINPAADRDVAGPDTWYTAVNDLDRCLLPRLQGVRDAVIKAHNSSGGSLAQLGRAMDVSRSTAQDRLKAISSPGPRRAQSAQWEQWAFGAPAPRGEASQDDSDSQ
ncbi:hypothetical protein ACGF5T_33400 [Streptomyces sp. NPDC047853]|uniref:hypothetical protein n=1 Tax=unclassified Streptomyces TaxID=2593676 RepID=UPI0034550C2C